MSKKVNKKVTKKEKRTKKNKIRCENVRINNKK